MVPYVIGWGKERLTAKSLDFLVSLLGMLFLFRTHVSIVFFRYRNKRDAEIYFWPKPSEVYYIFFRWSEYHHKFKFA